MAIERIGDGGTSVTGSADIARVQRLTLAGRLALEVRGISFKGPSTMLAVKRIVGSSKGTKRGVLRDLTAHMLAYDDYVLRPESKVAEVLGERELKTLIAVDTYTTTYAAWQEGEDEPERLSVVHAVDLFERVGEAVRFLSCEGAIMPSQMPLAGAVSLDDGGKRVWWADEVQSHVETGERTQKTFHLREHIPAQTVRSVHRGLAAELRRHHIHV